MQMLHIDDDGALRQLALSDQVPSTGIVWIDIPRERSADWSARLGHWLPAAIDGSHVDDAMSVAHPSWFEDGADYDLVIFEGVGPQADFTTLDPTLAAFFFFSRTLITVRAEPGPTFAQVRERLEAGRLRSPQSVLQLGHLLIDAMVDRFMQYREMLELRMTELQEQLLDSSDVRANWRELLTGRRAARRIEMMSENQAEALSNWRRCRQQDWSVADQIRIRDLEEHVERVRAHAANLERDVEAAVQLHFAMVGHHTNRVMQTLTVISAVFFPLTLITGIYGMNFDFMPELSWRYGYFVVLLLLLMIALILLLLFRRRRYL